MERISELMDGELDAREAQQQFSRIKQDQQLAHCWNTFHLIGDALRGERPLNQELSGRVAQRLKDEPTILAPRTHTASKRAATYAISLAASLSAVAVVVWIAFYNNPLAPQVATAPSAPQLVSAVAEPASVPSEGQMNEYLRAHTEYSPSTAIQGLAPYIRSVSGTQQAQGR